MDNLCYLVFSEIVQMVLFKIVPVCRYEYCRRTYSDWSNHCRGRTSLLFNFKILIRYHNVASVNVWRVGVHQIMTVNTVNNS